MVAGDRTRRNFEMFSRKPCQCKVHRHNSVSPRRSSQFFRERNRRLRKWSTDGRKSSLTNGLSIYNLPIAHKSVICVCSARTIRISPVKFHIHSALLGRTASRTRSRPIRGRVPVDELDAFQSKHFFRSCRFRALQFRST